MNVKGRGMAGKHGRGRNDFDMRAYYGQPRAMSSDYAREGYAQKARRRRKGRAWTAVLIVSLVVLAISLASLGAIGFSYWQGQKAYDRVSQAADLDVTSSSSFDLDSSMVDWSALSAINPDIVAWVYVPGTNINYPVVKGNDDSYYLTHDFEGSAGGITNNGCIFLHYDNASDFSDTGNFIFGHHLNDGTMFSAISDEKSVAEHRTVYLFTPTVNMKLRSFSLVHCGANDPLLQTEFSSVAAKRTYLMDIIDRSTVQMSDVPDVSKIDQFFAFSTCDNQISNGRYVMFCAVEKVGNAA